MTNDNDRMIKEKFDFFKDEKVEVHVKLSDKTFLNGFIEKELRPGVYWFIDNKLKGVYLFIKQIYDIKEFKEVY